MVDLAKRVSSFKIADLPPSTIKHVREPILAWSNGYAAFSEEFVRAVFDWAGVSGQDVVLDPMAGTGTVLLEAQRRGIPCIVGDMNPLVALLNLVKGGEVCAHRRKLLAKARAVAVKLDQAEARTKQRDLQADSWFSERQLAVIDEMRGSFRVDFATLSQGVTVGPGCGPDDISGYFALAGMALAASDFSLYGRSSNRTWLKSGGIDTMMPMGECFRRRIKGMISDLEAAYQHRGSSSFPPYTSMWCSAVSTPLPDRSVKLIVTSPPYPNRMDYIRMCGPGVQVLCRLFGLDPDSVDRRMIATNKVRHLDDAQLRLTNLRGGDGAYVKELLTQIRDDGAHGSRSYYYPYYAAYVASMQGLFRESARVLASDGAMVVVVQDSFRRGFPVQMDRIMCALARAEGLTPRVVSQHRLRRFFGKIRPGVAKDPDRLFQTEHTLVMTHK